MILVCFYGTVDLAINVVFIFWQVAINNTTGVLGIFGGRAVFWAVLVVLIFFERTVDSTLIT
jgi:hypothetical protein